MSGSDKMHNSILCYLEKAVKYFPDKEAVSDEKQTITFSQLQKSALNIAAVINQKGIGTKKPVFIYLPKSVECITAFTAVLYSGNFYTPSDVKFPFKRIQDILELLQPKLIISNSEYKKKLVENGQLEENILNIEEIDTSRDIDSDYYLQKIISSDPAYILFTSGSTGKPKGVIITNRSIIDYIDWAAQCYDVTSNDRIGGQAPFYFDNSTLDIYVTMAAGAHLYIIPEKLFSFPAMLMQYIVDNHINMVFWVPSVLINVANTHILERMDCRVLNKILFAGEVMPNKQLNYWRKHIPDALYSNLYGPTEITVDCTYYNVDRKFNDNEPLPIGRKCRNSDVFLLSEKDELVESQDITGEICVRGDSLSLGYWGNKEQTAENFVQNPLNTQYEEKIYRTGDLAYYNSYGELVFAGRKDYQIKHMGYRIELGEIEAALMGIPDVFNGCALYDSRNKKIIFVYCGGVDELTLRRYLINQLPKYMVPAEFYCIDHMPYNSNGKIDRLYLASQYIK